MKYVCMASGGLFDIPMFDPLVADHFNSPNSCTAELLRQICDERMYEKYFPRRGMVFLDLGANIGLVSIYAVENCKRIVAVEPFAGAFTVLKAMTHSFLNIEPICAAIAPNDGDCDFFFNDINSTANSTVNNAGVKTSVRGVTLNKLLKEAQLTHVDFCKVDIEGAEGESLTLAELDAAKGIIKEYYIEFHNCPKSSWEHKLGTATANLLRIGYHTMEIKGMGIHATR
jgi:FkbM family methyltransferase